MPQSDRPKGERIAKMLARAGVASRREVERMIAEGRIRIGDVTVSTPATFLENLKGVTVDGKPVKAADVTRLFAFHKPTGLITAERDPTGRPTIYSALQNAMRRPFGEKRGLTGAPAPSWGSRRCSSVSASTTHNSASLLAQ